MRWGLVDYEVAWERQKELFALRRSHQVTDLLILLQHPPTYTIGRKGNGDNLLVSMEELASLGAKLYWVERGGDVTYHGPGQIVGYPILDLKDIKRDVHVYLRHLEEVLILTLKDFGIEGVRKPGFTGVWVEDDKIASIGVSLSNWVTMHGFALNVNTELRYFDKIFPCGIRDKKVTSMKKRLSRAIEISEVEDSIVSHFANLFDRRVRQANETDEPLAIVRTR